MRILGIETSCDETGAAVIEGTNKNEKVHLLSNVVATSLAKHAETGGIIPEIAAREQVKCILPVISRALEEGRAVGDRKPATTEAQNKTETQKFSGSPRFSGSVVASKVLENPGIDAIAVTYGPGLIGSLLVGVETAKTLAMLWDVPLIPVNHMYGHIYANWIVDSQQTTVNNQHVEKLNVDGGLLKVTFPAVALVVSGGHTDLLYMEGHTSMKVIGGTRDDAAGEAFDKIGRLLGLPYPAGPIISKLAEQGNPKAFQLPRPMWDSKDYDFSFSGLKTAVLNLIKKNGWEFKGEGERVEQLLCDISASVQKAIIDVLVFKTLRAVEEYNVQTLLLGGGVAANKQLTDRLKFEIGNLKFEINLHVPPPYLSTDNAAMIAAAGFYHDTKVSWDDVTANPELYY